MTIKFGVFREDQKIDTDEALRNQDNFANRKLLISEEALKDEIGHWFEYCKSVADIGIHYGVETFVAVHKDAKKSVLSELQAKPVYVETSWDGMHVEPNTLQRYWGIVTHNWLVYRTMDKLLGELGAVDVIFAPTVTIHHVLGWRLLLAKNGGRRFNRLVLLFRNNAGYYDSGCEEPKFSRPAKILGLILRTYKKSLKCGMTEFATDSDRLAKEYLAISTVRPTVFPSPRVAPRYVPIENASLPTTCLKFCSLGPARFEKGIDILQEAVERILEIEFTDIRVEFIIQWNSDILSANGDVYYPSQSLMSDDRVTILTEALSSEDYLEVLSSSHCVLLPYRRDSYFSRISGVAVEAATAGKPMIYTKETWCEEFAVNFGAGISVKDGSVESLVEAIQEMVLNFSNFSDEAFLRAEEAAKMHNPEEFMTKLWGV